MMRAELSTALSGIACPRCETWMQRELNENFICEGCHTEWVAYTVLEEVDPNEADNS